MDSPRMVDLTGLKCPLPIVYLNNLIRELSVGEQLRVTANDPAFSLDVEAWCRKTNHKLIGLEMNGEVIQATIQKMP